MDSRGALKKYFGYDAFRPLQQEIIDDALSGRDVFALLPTGGGKSLCFQLPALLRDDIIKQLKLHAPRCYVASFNRPNLTYRVVAKSSAYQQVLDFIRVRPNESGIIYCASRKSTDALAEKITKDGIKALPYHAGMESRERTRNQEAFLRDDARVITATIAFGMRINKPNVRFVIHHDLPKNIEGYYQGT